MIAYRQTDRQTKVFIVDTDNNPLPVGVSGELLIGGSALMGAARNYRHQTEYPDLGSGKDSSARLWMLQQPIVLWSEHVRGHWL